MIIQLRAAPSQPSHIDTLACDAFEKGLLAIARHFWLAISRKDTVAWHRAYTIAAERFGERIGFPAGHQIAKIMCILVDLRGDGLCFIDPLDIGKKTTSRKMKSS